MAYPEIYIHNDEYWITTWVIISITKSLKGPSTERNRIQAALDTLNGDMDFFIAHSPPILTRPEDRFVVQVELLYGAVDALGAARTLAIDELEHRLSLLTGSVYSHQSHGDRLMAKGHVAAKSPRVEMVWIVGPSSSEA
ncbi:predicted protein [Aspergillus terreus NIH2624]|uniref:Uncharacterized protein n=1 Tax=Aspergillus terreus (strain NIH 2624 / FGSC A1156) TaxID=341663 RepID=Q0CEY3_ASPTN|nr:uncharacterized protein ATEG_07751 [Aspergillus terreus NIH2624]EAU32013.1 predicted protein [Aspergillus terreus NIH2624]